MTWRAVFAGGDLAPDAERRVLDALRRCWDEVTGHDTDAQANVYTDHHGGGAVATVTDANNQAMPTTATTDTTSGATPGEANPPTTDTTGGPAPADQTATEAVPGTAQAPQEAVDAGTVATDQPPTEGAS